MRLTDKQLEVLTMIANGNDDSSLIDLDELLERLSYKPTKEAIQFSIRALIKHELIEKAGSEKRRGRRRITYRALPLGEHYANAYAPKPAFVGAGVEDILEGI